MANPEMKTLPRSWWQGPAFQGSELRPDPICQACSPLQMEKAETPRMGVEGQSAGVQSQPCIHFLGDIRQQVHQSQQTSVSLSAKQETEPLLSLTLSILRWSAK